MRLTDDPRFAEACEEARIWAGDRTIAEAWRDCPRGDWMLWGAQRLDAPRRQIVEALARQAQLVAHLAIPEAQAEIDATLAWVAEPSEEAQAAVSRAQAAARAAWAAAWAAAWESVWESARAAAWESVWESEDAAVAAAWAAAAAEDAAAAAEDAAEDAAVAWAAAADAALAARHDALARGLNPDTAEAAMHLRCADVARAVIKIEELTL